MNIEEFFNDFPIYEPKELTNDDLKSVFDFCVASTKMYKKEDHSMTKEQKIEDYKNYCKQQLKNKFSNLSYEGKLDLDKYFNLYGTVAILQHLTD